eukprot:Filipodium_phascolosomae@DN5971_c0_g1_i1.p1
MQQCVNQGKKNELYDAFISLAEALAWIVGVVLIALVATALVYGLGFRYFRSKKRDNLLGRSNWWSRKKDDETQQGPAMQLVIVPAPQTAPADGATPGSGDGGGVSAKSAGGGAIPGVDTAILCTTVAPTVA